MKIRKKSIVLALVVTVLGVATMPSLFSLVVYALANPVITITTSDNTSDVKGVKKWVDDVNKELEDTEIDSDIKNEWVKNDALGNFKFFDYEASNQKSITIILRKTGEIEKNKYVAGYDDIDTKSKNKVMEVALSTLDESKQISRTNKVKIYNFIYNSDESTASMVKQLSSDTKADFYSAYASLKDIGFLKFVSWFLGVMSIAIFTLLAITLSLDLAYINIPFIQLFFDDNKLPELKILNKGNKTLGEQFISYEARQAAMLASSTTLGSKSMYSQSPVVFYLKSKTLQLSVLFICLLYIVSGQIYTLLANFMDLFSSWLDL